MQLGREKISIETGKVAKQADGSAWVEYGGTVVLVTAVASRREANVDFLPLTVDYRERGYAGGKIPGVYGRREPRPGVTEQLTSRLIDHCIRPLFPEGYNQEVQVLCSVLSYDKKHLANVPALIGTSAALCMSDIPFNGPVGGIVVGRIDNQLIVNPTSEETEQCDLELFVSGNQSAVMSVEGHMHEVPEDEVIDAIVFAHQQIKEIIKLQDGLIAVCGTEKREFVQKSIDENLRQKVTGLATERIRQSIGIADKQERSTLLGDLKADVLDQLISSEIDDETVENYTQGTETILKDLEKYEMRESILNQGTRIDGRGATEVRQISSEVSLLPYAHGSSLFTRGQTQALCAVTLGTGLDEDIERSLAGEKNKPFFLHYNFPPYSVGEVRRMMGPGRREIGHGSLAESAIKAVVPNKEEFNYTIRVVSEILESNASSSMATVCGATMALLDAGVPLKKLVAGVGVGLIKDGDRETILTDMIGMEDFLGDMDFKVAGTQDGVTAIQMDIKIDGVTPELMKQAIHQSREARLFVLEQMEQVISSPRAELSPHAPRINTIKIPVEKIRDVIGPRGKVVQQIQEETGVTISIEDDGRVEIASTDANAALAAEERVREITAVPEVDKEYKGEVVRIAPFGAFVKILPNCDGMVHISQMGNGYVRQVEDILSVGDTVQVRVLSIDDQNRVDLALSGESAEKANEISANAPPREESQSRDNSGPRRNSGYRDGGNRRRERNSNRSGGGNRHRDEGQPRNNSLRVPKDRF
jgi:polyribonucleotide nucleotidyltransferase